MKSRLLPGLLLTFVLAFAGRAELEETATEAAPSALTSLPTGKGLPVVVLMGLRYVEVDSIDETEAAYTATVDLRLRWQDLRLQYPPESAPQGFLEFRDEAAAAKIAEIWTPVVSLQNLSGEPSQQMRALRIFPDGRVEMMLRTTGTFETPFEVERFPFDRQRLQVEVVSRRESVEQLSLEFEQDDLDFSQAPETSELREWVPGVVSLKRDVVSGWYGEYLSRVTVSLAMKRRAGSSAALIFIPLIASLLIPLLAIWLNRIEEGEFQIEAFEQGNIIVGGLFAVIALNFTLNAEYGTLGTTDNTVRRLFALNYVALAISLIINLTLFRFNLPMRWFGRYVQEQVFLFLSWAVPLLVLATALALLLIAMA
jgi:Neurotransmitter-gated ion-channel ligand binding domain